jgi:toxin ParE1/3/4
MTPYLITKEAENDLREVARYTLKTWGKDIFEQYRKGLNEIFSAIGNGTVTARSLSARHPQVQTAKYRYHYVFFIKENLAKPVIIGVIHEKRDIVNPLQGRLTY